MKSEKMMRRWSWFVAAGFGAAALIACDGDDTLVAIDGGHTDATSGVDGSVDAGGDASLHDSMAPMDGTSPSDASDAHVSDGALDAHDGGASDASDAATDAGTPDANEAGASDAASDASDAAVVDAGPCGHVGEACCTTGSQCNDVTLSCVTSTCQHVIAIDVPSGVYTLNGISAPALSLKSGTTYTLKFSNPSFHPFVFTTSSTGGTTAGELTSAQIPGYVAGGACGSGCTTNTMTITPNSTLASSFFYQCDIHTGLGNTVTVVP